MKKLNLKELKVSSFITKMTKKEGNTVVGATGPKCTFGTGCPGGSLPCPPHKNTVDFC